MPDDVRESLEQLLLDANQVMEQTQVTAALGLLRKIVPDIKAIEHTGAEGGPIEYTERKVNFVEPALEARTRDPLASSDDRGQDRTRH